MKIKWHKLAKQHLYSIITFIKEDSPKSAIAFLDNVFETIGKVSIFNHFGHKVYEFENDGLREILIWSYRFIYEIFEDKIIILGIIHSKRNFEVSERK